MQYIDHLGQPFYITVNSYWDEQLFKIKISFPNWDWEPCFINVWVYRITIFNSKFKKTKQQQQQTQNQNNNNKKILKSS